jgi:hypothetical protein
MSAFMVATAPGGFRASRQKLNDLPPGLKKLFLGKVFKKVFQKK